MNQQPHGPGFSQQVGVDAQGSLSSQFASRPPIPPPPGQPPSQIPPPPGLPPSQVSNQYQGVSSVPYQPGMHAAAYTPSSQPHWDQAQPIQATHGHDSAAQVQNTGQGVGVQQLQGNFASHPTGHTQSFSTQGSQSQPQAPTTTAHVPNSTQYNPLQQTSQFSQAVAAPPGISPQYASQSPSYFPAQQPTQQNPHQGNTGGSQNMNHSQAIQNQYQYQDPNQGQNFNPGAPGYQGQTQPQTQYTTGVQQAPVYSQAGQTFTSQAPQYGSYKPQAAVNYGGNEHLQQQPQQNPSYNPQQYGDQPHGNSFGGAPSR